MATEKKTFFALCYNNRANVFHENKGWQCANIFDHYPSLDEIMKTSTFGTGYVADRKLAELLTDGSRRPACIIYKEYSPMDKFFEAMVLEFEFGEDLNLWGLFITGISNLDEERCVMWTDETYQTVEED